MSAATIHAPRMPRPRARRWLRRTGFWLSVVVIVSPAILVFLWMLSLSLKNEIDNLAYPPVIIPSPPTGVTAPKPVMATRLMERRA